MMMMKEEEKREERERERGRHIMFITGERKFNPILYTPPSLDFFISRIL